jgi:predicted amidophosphoribosyltransferase
MFQSPESPFVPSESLAQHVANLFEACSSLDRGDVLLHTTTSEVLGVAPYEGHWKSCIEKLKRRMEDERGITIWHQNGVGYRLLTRNEQLTVVPRHRMRKARRQYAKAQRSIDALADPELSAHQRLVKQRQEESLRNGLAVIEADLRRQAAILRPVEGRPRPAVQMMAEV